MSPAMGLQFRLGNSICPDEIASLKLVITDTASLLADASGGNLVEIPVAMEEEEEEEEGGNGDDFEVRTLVPGSDDGDSVSVEPEPPSVDGVKSAGAPAEDLVSGPPPLAELDHAKHVLAAGAGESSVPAVVEPVVQVSRPSRSMFLMDYMPLWGCTSVCGWRPEMEDSVAAVPHFFEIPLWMLTGDCTGTVDGLDRSLVRLPGHFFGVYDGHGGSQVANYCRDRIHMALIEELRNFKQDLGGNDWQKQWERSFIDCFHKVDDEVGGRVSRGGIAGSDDPCGDGSYHHTCIASPDPVAPQTVGSTAVVAVICSSHIIIANCGDSRAVLCRGKQSVPLSVDHKPDREDEYARIEAEGGKVIQWNGHRIFGVLAMSRSIGDRYLKPWIIPVPEITVVPRTREDECLILASDGLWDVMTNEEVCDAARRRILQWHKKNGVILPSAHRGEEADPAAQAAADYLLKLAMQKGSRDNITVIVVDLKARRKFKSRS